MKGLILHKPINLGPLRINISKTGIGFSLALPFKGRACRCRAILITERTPR